MRIEEASAEGAEVGEGAGVGGEGEEAVPVAGLPAVGVHRGELDTAGQNVPTVGERTGDAVDQTDVRLFKDQREASRMKLNAGVPEGGPGLERRLVVAPQQQV